MKDKLWAHYPENDIVVEHWSCCFGIVVRIEDRWESFALSSCFRKIHDAEELMVERWIGEYPVEKTAKKAVEACYKNNLGGVKGKSVTAVSVRV